MPAIGIRCTVLLTLSLWFAPAIAQDNARIVLEIEAPAPLRQLLEQHLEVPATVAEVDETERLRLLRSLRKQTADLLATEGYFSPRIEVSGQAGGSPRVEVDAGQRATVSSVDLRFAGDITGAGEARAARLAALRQAWPLAQGQPFRQSAWDAAKQALLQRLLAEDYAAARITDSRAEVDPIQASVRLHVEYDSGPAFTIGALEVQGLENYERALIDRYNKLVPGERYKQERLLELQRTLQNAPYFSSVVVDIDNDPERPSAVPVRVRVSEARRMRLSLGAGYSSNHGARAELTFRHANVLDRGWQLSSGFRVDRLGRIGYADIHLPPRGNDYRDGFGVLGESNDNQGLKTTRYGLGAVRTRTRGKIETRLSLNFERQKRIVDAGETTRFDALVLNYAWTWRDVDNLIDPRVGQVVHAQIGGAAKALLSDQDFLRAVVRVQKYWPLFERDMLTARAEFGWIGAASRKGIPEEYLFRAGGAQSVRGYSYQSLGVREGEAIVGGRYMTSASLEYVRWFTADWGGAVFFDAGDATDNLRDLTNPARGYGIGARWRSPAGPLAFDLAYGQREGKLRPVFSIAIAF